MELKRGESKTEITVVLGMPDRAGGAHCEGRLSMGLLHTELPAAAIPLFLLAIDALSKGA